MEGDLGSAAYTSGSAAGWESAELYYISKALYWVVVTVGLYSLCQ